MGNAHNPVEPNVATAATATTSSSAPPITPPADGGSVLIVDDTPMSARLLGDILGFHGYTTHIAASGGAALDVLARDAIDLVVLDIVMPGIDGFETCRRIRAMPGHVMLPVVMATSLDSKQERVRGLEAGADDFLSKPINRDELLARVRSLMRIKRLYETVTVQRTALAALAKSLEARVIEEVAKSERLSSLKRFFSPQLVELIVAGGADNPLQSHRREITVVFLDLRGFTAFAETGEPEVVMQALSEFHQAMGQLVMHHQGTLERFTGDGMMVFFNDPVPVAEPNKRAAQMALEMCAEAETLRLRWAKRGFSLGLGIGIAHGFATVGAIGFDRRIDYAAIGPVTNLAARLCAHAQAGEILVSQRAFGAIEDAFNAEPLGEIPMRGFAKPVTAVRLIGVKVEAA